MEKLIKLSDAIKALCEDGTWLERQGVYTLTLAEAKQRAVDVLESVPTQLYIREKTQTKTQNSNLTFEKDGCSKEYEELGLKELKELRIDRWWDADGTEHIEKCCHKPESLQYRAYCSEPKEDTECRGCGFWY